MIAARTVLHLGRSLLLALLLLVVAAHAVSPLVQPLERATGSAFSAATHDVAVVKGATQTIVKRTAPALPPLLPATPQVVLPIAQLPIGHLPLALHPAPTGPLAAETSFSPLAPRAPPAA